MTPARKWASVAGLFTGLAIGVADGIWQSRKPREPQTYPTVKLVPPSKKSVERRKPPVIAKATVLEYQARVAPYDTVFASARERASRDNHPSSREDLDRILRTQPASVHQLPARLPPGEGFGLPPKDLARSYALVITYGPNREWNWMEELAERQRLSNRGLPYVITKEEFEESEPQFDTDWLYFFPNEGMLCDEEYNDLGAIENITGPLPFGHGHHEDHKICIRNEVIETDFEVECIENETYADWVERQVLREDKLPPGAGDGHVPGAS